MKKQAKINILVILFVILMLVLIYVKFQKDNDETSLVDEQTASLFSNVNSLTYASITKYIVYGTHLNFEGTIEIAEISDISVSNVNIILTNLNGQEQTVDAEFSYDDNQISFSTTYEINGGINLDDLEISNYFIFLKVAFSNNETYYYSFQNASDYKNIDYYTVTKNDSNNNVKIKFDTYNDKDYMGLFVSVADSLPDDVYDIVIDPGHGGTDSGTESDGYNEADLVLEVATELQQLLEESGYKVLLTRDSSLSSYKDISDVYGDEGRVTIANESNAKLLISLHMDSNTYSLSSGGIEVYAPCNCDLTFAQTLANNLVSIAKASYSPLNSHKKYDGVYVHNFSSAEITALENSAEKNGYEPYDVDTSTPYLYIIRETGGIATNAYVDGRNENYSANKYYDSNVGIESYLIELGYIDIEDDLENLLANQSLYAQAIFESIQSLYNN